MILEGYDEFGSTEDVSGALRNILDYQGVVAPHAGEPFTEAMLMGIGGGIGAEYLAWTSKESGIQLFLRFWHTRDYSTKKPQGLVHKIASRIGAKLIVHQTSSRERGHRTLVESLNEGRPLITYLSIWEDLKMRPELKKRVDQFEGTLGSSMDDEFVCLLPYYSLPYTWIAVYHHCVVVYGIHEDAGSVHVSDWSTQPLVLTVDELAESRAAVPGRRHAAIIVEPPTAVRDLGKAIRAGIRDCHRGLLNPSMKNLRVDAFEKWAKLIANRRNKMGWPRMFSNHVLLFDALTQVHGLVEFFNSSGGALRSTYADFLEEASDVIGEPRLRNVSLLYRDLASRWTDLANAALPDSVPLFKDARLAALKWNDIFLTKGQSAPRRLEKAAEKIRSIRSQVADSFPLSEAEVVVLLEDMSTHLFRIYEGEREALVALKSVVP